MSLFASITSRLGAPGRGACPPAVVNRAFGAVALFALFSLLSPGISSSEGRIISDKDRLLSALPRDGEAGEWLRHDDPLVYEGEDLFIYINGGAEIYMEYGFRAAIVQDYRSPGGRDISVEIFSMESSEAAFGMYAFKKSGKGERSEIGEEGELSGYYLNFRKGSEVATLTGFDEDPETVAGLSLIGAALDTRLPGRGDLPGLLGVLPDGSEGERNRNYIKGPLGLADMLPHLSPFLSPHRIREGAGAISADGSMIAVLRFGSSDDAASAFEALAAAAAPDGRFRNLRRPDDSFLGLSTDKGREIAAAVRGDLVVLAETDDPESGSAMVHKTLDGLGDKNRRL